MKKLISLLAAISVVSACSLSAFASEFTINGSETNKLTATDAATQTTYEKGDNGLYTVDLSSVAGDQDQTTILAVKGNNIAVGSIQYIGQSADKTFSFDLKDNLTEQVNVLAGGSKISPTLVGNMKPAQTQTGYTISGAVSDPAVAEADLDNMVEDLGEEGVAYFKNSWGTKVSLVNRVEDNSNIANYMLGYLGEEAEMPTPIATVTADVNTGAYSFKDIAVGNYVLIFERAGALPLLTYVTVTDSNVTVPTKELLLGELIQDLSFDGSDIQEILNAQSTYGDENYNALLDIVPDWSLDGTDIQLILTNAGASYDDEAFNDALAALD